MNTDCINRAYSDDYQDYIVEYFGMPTFLDGLNTDDCFNIISNRYAIAYRRGYEVETGLNHNVYTVPQCYGLMSSLQVLDAAGIAKVQRQPALSMYGSGVMVGFIDTGCGVR